MSGRTHSEKTREHISTSLKDFFQNNGMSEETRNKISVAKNGAKHSQETRQKMSASKKGNTYAQNHPHSRPLLPAYIYIQSRYIYVDRKEG